MKECNDNEVFTVVENDIRELRKEHNSVSKAVAKIEQDLHYLNRNISSLSDNMKDIIQSFKDHGKIEEKIVYIEKDISKIGSNIREISSNFSDLEVLRKRVEDLETKEKIHRESYTKVTISLFTSFALFVSGAIYNIIKN